MLDLYLGIRLKKNYAVLLNFSASIIVGLCAAWLGVMLAK
jgi:fluoride ion exporter CrcB/FEX